MSAFNTFLNNSHLPRLPVPSLEETCAKYLKTLRPIVSEEAYETSVKAVKKFLEPNSFGRVLQERLLQRAEEKKQTSWLIDWWNDYAYLGYRDSVVINVNYFFQFVDDSKYRSQVDRAASIIKGALAFRRKLLK